MALVSIRGRLGRIVPLWLRCLALGLAISHAHVGASLLALAKASPLQSRQHAQYSKGRAY